MGMQMLRKPKMKKNIKENYSSSPTDSEQLVNGSYNISKVDDPIELKRLNNYITTVLSSGPFQSRKDTLINLRLKMNLLGFDFDAPKSMRDSGPVNINVPLKRFGGITGIDDKGGKLDNPYGPGVKLDMQLSGQDDFFSVKIVPAASSQLPSETQVSMTPEPETKEEPKVEVKESRLSNILKYFRK